MGYAQRMMMGRGAAAALAACAGKTDPVFIGSAIVEAETWQVPALTQGRIAALYKQEGQAVAAGEVLAVIDTVPYALQLREALAGLSELAAGTRAKQREIKGGQAEIKGL